MIHFLDKTKTFQDRIAIRSAGKAYSYDALHRRSDTIASKLLTNTKDIVEDRIAFLIDPSFSYTATQWGIWKAGGIAVPLCILHPLPSIEYVLRDIECKVLITEEKYEHFLRPLISSLKIHCVIYENIKETITNSLPDIIESRRAMILYTSGTTSLPKGVVTTHANIKAQISTLVEAWSWSREDHILNILPLHHVHGIINVMSCALWAGACCEFLPKFEADRVWEKLSAGSINVFMAVPTIFFKLIRYWEEATIENQQKLSGACQSFRLMISGSAALPVSVLKRWQQMTGLILLERYGMTEIGMGLSNPYEGERRPGHVGLPLPGVQVRLADDQDIVVNKGEQGEIQIKGPSVFKEYWRKPIETSKAFTADGWFRTGDVAILSDRYYKILGRTSVDIIKSGGYKISALEIEEVLRTHPKIDDCGIIGLPDEEWGEVIAAALVCDPHSLNLEELKVWIKERLPHYRVPRKYIFIDDLPRNTLGKVTKNKLKEIFIPK